MSNILLTKEIDRWRKEEAKQGSNDPISSGGKCARGWRSIRVPGRLSSHRGVGSDYGPEVDQSRAWASSQPGSGLFKPFSPTRALALAFFY